MKNRKPILRIKELMQIRDVSREHLAEKVGVSVTTISNICSEVNYPKVELLPIIAEALDVDIRELFNSTKGTVISKSELEEAKDYISRGLRLLEGKKLN